jgi:hypothetical protein
MLRIRTCHYGGSHRLGESRFSLCPTVILLAPWLWQERREPDSSPTGFDRQKWPYTVRQRPVLDYARTPHFSPPVRQTAHYRSAAPGLPPQRHIEQAAIAQRQVEATPMTEHKRLTGTSRRFFKQPRVPVIYPLQTGNQSIRTKQNNCSVRAIRIPFTSGKNAVLLERVEKIIKNQIQKKLSPECS